MTHHELTSEDYAFRNLKEGHSVTVTDPAGGGGSSTNLIEVIDQTRSLLGAVRQSLIRVAMNLHILRENETRPWAEVCEDLDISQGFSSKLLTINKHYILEGGMAPEQLEGTDYESLYLASKTGGSPEEQIARAQTLTRAELRLERDEMKDHEHEPISICKHCGKRL